MVNVVRGDKQLVAKLRRLGAGLPLSQVDKAATVSMMPMLKVAQGRAKATRNYIGKHPGFPQPKGGRKHVDQLLRVGKTGRQTKSRRKFLLGAVGRARGLLHLLEFGTISHFQPRFRGGFQHPGSRPHPIVTPAYHQEGDDVPGRFGKAIWVVIVANISRYGGKR